MDLITMVSLVVCVIAALIMTWSGRKRWAFGVMALLGILMIVLNIISASYPFYIVAWIMFTIYTVSRLLKKRQ